MNYKTLRIALHVVGSIVAFAWIIEAFTIGRGFISTYLAPFAFGPLVVASLMAMNEKKLAKAESDKARPSQEISRRN